MLLGPVIQGVWSPHISQPVACDYHRKCFCWGMEGKGCGVFTFCTLAMTAGVHTSTPHLGVQVGHQGGADNGFIHHTFLGFGEARTRNGYMTQRVAQSVWGHCARRAQCMQRPSGLCSQDSHTQLQPGSKPLPQPSPLPRFANAGTFYTST